MPDLKFKQVIDQLHEIQYFEQIGLVRICAIYNYSKSYR